MSLVANVHLSSPSLPLVALLEAVPSTVVELDRMLTTDRQHPVLVFWAETESFGAFESALDRDDSVATYSTLESDSEERLYHLRLAEPVLLSLKAAFVELGAAPGDATITDEGWTIQARFPDRGALARFRDACIERDVGFRLDQLYESTPDEGDLSGLTSKQREALLLANERGYYDLPRRVSLGELAEQLDISAPSLSARLRRAERRLVENAITNGPASI